MHCRILDRINHWFYEVEERRDEKEMGLEVHLLPKLILDRYP